jgi:hypothetical protein
VRDPLWRNARAVPSLDLRFADNKSLVDAVTGASLVTFTRASSGTFVDSAGVLQTAATDVPRFDHNPTTLESLGLLVEEQKTNSIRNNTMVGAVAGTPGTIPTNWTLVAVAGLSSSVVGTGTENGIAYIDVQINGTPTTSTFSNIIFDTSIAASSGQAWASSVYVKLAAGSLTNTSIVQEIREVTALGTFLTNSTQTVTPTSAALNTQRALLTRTLNNALTTNVRPIVSFQTTNGAAIDITLRVGLPQLEQGALATLPIPTTTAAVTRSASLADLISSAIANNIRTLYLEFRSPASGTRGVVSLNDNTADERVNVLTSGTDPRLVVVDGGVEQANVNGGTVTANQRTRIAVRINANDFAISINGGAVVTDTSGTLPTVDRLMLGRTQAGEYLNGPLARVTGWTQLLPDSTLQSLAQ